MDEVKWDIYKPGNVTGEKIPYVSSQRANDNMKPSEKEGVRVWNLMRKTLLDHNLMEDKG